MPKDFLEHDVELGRVQRDNFRKAVAAGVKMSFGTDAGVCAYGTSAASSNAADLLGHSSEIRIDQAGKFADIVAVTGDPLTDVRLLENVQFAMKDGKIYKQ